jgi:hypothetical protein
MPVVIDLCDEVSTALDEHRGHFGAPAFHHFQRYVLGLMVSEELSVEGIDRIFLNRVIPTPMTESATTKDESPLN